MSNNKPQPMTFEPVVKKPFRYGKKRYQPGQVFQPLGGKFDQSIIKNYCYMRAQDQPAPKEAAHA